MIVTRKTLSLMSYVLSSKLLDRERDACIRHRSWIYMVTGATRQRERHRQRNHDVGEESLLPALKKNKGSFLFWGLSHVRERKKERQN